MRYAMRLVAAAVLAAVSCVTARAQTDQQFSQYYEVPAYYNAGAIGTGDLVRIRGGAKLQWVGIDRAPQTFAAMADMPVRLGAKQRIGVGLLMQQESAGLYSNLNIGAQVAYKLNLRKLGTLSIGVQVGYVDEGFKGSKVDLPDEDDYHQGSDDAIPTQDIRGGALDLGLGLYYTHPRFWAGLSATHLNSPSVKMNAESGGEGESARNYQFDMPRTLYLMGGCNIQIKNTLFEVIPSLMVKTDLTFWSGEVTARVRYNKFISGGVGYRYNDAVYATVAAEFKGFFLGYAYDYPMSAVSKASSGSHEIVAGYSLKLDFSEKNKNKHKSIRIL